MSTLTTPALKLRKPSHSREARRFHLLMAVICGIAICISVVGSRLTSTHYSGIGDQIIGLLPVTTGWHYFVGVLGGIAVAGVSIAVAKACTRMEFNRIRAAFRAFPIAKKHCSIGLRSAHGNG